MKFLNFLFHAFLVLLGSIGVFISLKLIILFLIPVIKFFGLICIFLISLILLGIAFIKMVDDLLL